eukprot:TRINITY_DN95248_c0_g1_i1.p1 TRINITY_DN95248_c0_g1~~TRINITY_DN95248_c0_g1_i1.p1  ORF type:complete len:281 (+),score=34.56 TRINITY_DN95248_c0_g1_i1:93-935(+)
MDKPVIITVLILCSNARAAVTAGTAMEVIGAGFGRSGTASMYLALNELGYKTYHMVSVLKSSEHSRPWGALWDKSGTVDDALDVVAKDGYNASMDFPISIAYKDLMRRNPNAKVILTLRESGSKWAGSFLETIAKATKPWSKAPFTFLRPGLGDAHKWMYTEAGMKLDETSWMPTLESAAQAYEAWSEEVQRFVPKEQLLVFKVGDGWEPLCKFLEVAKCPEGPFPRAPNDRVFMIRFMFAIDFISTWWFLLCPTLLALCAGSCYLCCTCCRGAGKEKSS